jgi:hypothetical protein
MEVGQHITLQCTDPIGILTFTIRLIVSEIFLVKNRVTFYFDDLNNYKKSLSTAYITFCHTYNTITFLINNKEYNIFFVLKKK